MPVSQLSEKAELGLFFAAHHALFWANLVRDCRGFMTNAVKWLIKTGM
jgi:hypothetical protein